MATAGTPFRISFFPVATSYLPVIGLMRGLAAVMVAGYHVLHFTFDGIPWIPDGWWLKEWSRFGPLGVRIFFVISGFVIPWSMWKNGYSLTSLPRFLLKRTLRIEGPYVASILLLLLVAWHYTQISWYQGPPFSVNLEDIRDQLLYLCDFRGKPWMNDVYWSLAIEFQFYVVMALLFPLLAGADVRISIGVIAGFVATDALMDYHPLLFHYGSLFAAGMWVFLWHSGKIGREVCMVGMIMICACIGADHGIPEGLVCLLSAACIAWVRFGNRLSEFMGRISYSLYLIHGPLAGRLVLLSLPWLWSFRRRVLFLGVVGLFLVIVSWLFYAGVEGPFQKLSQRLDYRKKTPDDISGK